MEKTAKQIQQMVGKPDALCSWLEEAVSQIASKVAAELKPVLEQAKQEGAKQPNEGEALRKENAVLKAKVAWLEGEMQEVKDYLRELVSQQQSKAKVGHAKPDGQTKEARQEESGQEAAHQGQTEPSQPSNNQAEAVDEERAEKWLRENLAAWLDQRCPFKLATGRTWRELGENKGEKITMNGKGLQPPRAYLHALENWQECKVWQRMKAKVALEVCKNGNGTHKAIAS